MAITNDDDDDGDTGSQYELAIIDLMLMTADDW